MTTQLQGWRTTTHRGEDGAVRSEQRALASRPIVDESVEGAAELARSYWIALERVSFLARVIGPPGRVRIRALRFGPVLLEFGDPEVTVADGTVAARYPIAGGLLARRPAGTITFSQVRTDAGWEIRSTVAGFRPMLPSVLYEQIQRRVHVAVGRRYVRTLLRRAA